MVVQGIVRDNVVVLPPEVCLPDGSSVVVVVGDAPVAPPCTGRDDRNGVPVYPASKVADRPSLEVVNRLRDGDA